MIFIKINSNSILDTAKLRGRKKHFWDVGVLPLLVKKLLCDKSSDINAKMFGKVVYSLFEPESII